MELFQVLSGICSILSLILTIIISYKIYKVEIRIRDINNSELNQSQNTVNGDMAGGDINK